MRESKFKGKVVWITGASSGIGEALARHFATLGSRLILSSRRENELKRVAGLCKDSPSVSTLPLDLGKPESMAEAVRVALARESAVDVMVHNGAVGQRAYISEASYEIDDLIMHTNYLGPVALTKALLPSMRSRRAGHFIVISSVLGKFGLPGRSGYSASKHALHGFFDTRRGEVWPDNSQVTLALPGWVRTNISMNALTGQGMPQRKMDSGTASGFTPEYCAARIVAAAEAGKAEVNIVRLREHSALWLSRFAPGLFRRLLRGRTM